MTVLSQHWRRLILVLVVVTGSVAWGVPAGSDIVVAAPELLTDDTADPSEQVVVSQDGAERDKQRPRRFVDADTDEELPVNVYVGESVDISSVKLNGSGTTIGEGSIGLAEVNDRDTVSVNASDADFSDVEPGVYSADGNDSPEIRVRRPDVTDLSLFDSKDEDNQIISGRIDGSETVYLNPIWNFDEADTLELTVTDPDGLDVTTQIVDPDDSESADDVVDATVGDGFVAESGQDIALNFTGASAGEYTISASGSDFGPTMSTSLTLVREPVSLSFESDPVIQGDTAVANVSGLSRQTVYIRVDDGELADDVPAIQDADGRVEVTNDTASKLFYGSGVTGVGGTDLGTSPTSETGDDLIALVDLGDDGAARFGVRTTYLNAPNEVRFTLATPSEAGSLADRIQAGETVDEPTLNVSKAALSVQSAPDTITTTDEFTITGLAAGVNEVALYVRQDDGWYPVDETAGDHVVPVSNGTFGVETVADGRFAIPDSYLLGLVSVEEVEEARGLPIDRSPVISKPTWNNLDSRTSLAVRTTRGNLSAYLTSRSLVVDDRANDEIQLRGSSSGQGDKLRLYIIGPRGTLYADSLTGRTVDVVNGSVAYSFGESLSREGIYHVVLVGRGRDASFAAEEVSLRPLESSRRSAQQKRQIILDSYSGPGVDDRVVSTSFRSVDPVVTIDVVGQRDRVPPSEVTLSGRTNRGEDKRVYVSVFDSNGTLAAATTGRINGTNNSWMGSINFSGAEPGLYTIIASGPDTETQREIRLVSLPMPMQDVAPQGDATSNVSQNESESGGDGEATAQPTSEPSAPSVGFISSIPIVIGIFTVAIVLSFALLLRFRGED